MKKSDYFIIFLILSCCLSIDLCAQVESIGSDQPLPVQIVDNATSVSAPLLFKVNVSDPYPADNPDVNFYGLAKVGTAAKDFTLVLIPDSQNESQYYPAVFTSMTNWIVSQQSGRNIVFVTTLGDMVNNAGSTAEYDNADAAMDKLDPAGVPYSVGAGNHDHPTTNFNSYFGISRFSGKSWYAGHYSSTNDNSYSLFTASGMDFILINLDYNPSGAVLDWADALLKSNSDRRAIVESHSRINIDNSWTNQSIYTALKDNPNLFLMLCGHMHTPSDGAAYRSELGDDGHTRHIMQADYQNFPNGGNGYMRILRFSPVADKIYATTYSPYSGTSITTSPDQMEMVYDMADGIIPPPSSYSITGGGSFCQGGSGLPVGLANSETGVTYTLYKGAVAQNPAVSGNGAAINFGNRSAGVYTVTGTNGGGTTAMTGSAVIIENLLPEIPQITVTQPTCALATGSVVLSHLPPSGTWILTRTPGGMITGAGTIITLSGLTTGTYTYVVTASGCASAKTADAVIDAQPAKPVTPVITLNSNILHSSSINGNHWYKQSVFINGAIYQDYTAVSDGNYYVIVAHEGCFSEPSNAINLVLTGVEQQELTKITALYPNPTNGKVTINITDENVHDIVIDILNINGQTLITEKIEVYENQTEISLEGLSKGTYFIRITYSGNSDIKTVILQ